VLNNALFHHTQLNQTRRIVSAGSDPGHGNSPAAWTAVIIMLIAFAIGTLAFWFDIAWLVWAAAGLFVVGAIVGLVLKRAGFGVGGDRLKPTAHS
jgi:VIT1/CCC1 family predicted Fe2+/Mn2+ transporter